MGTKSVELGDVIELNPNLTLPKGKVARKIPMESLTPNQRSIDSFHYEPYSGGAKFQNGDTLMARITPSLENGKTAYVDLLGKDEIAYGSTEFAVLRVKKVRMLPKYLYYLAISEDFRQTAIKSMTGTSGRQRVQNDAIMGYRFDLPTIEDQRRVVSVLDALDTKCKLNRMMNHDLMRLCKLTFRRLRKGSVGRIKLPEIAELEMGQSPRGSTYNTRMLGVPLLNGAADFRGGIHPSKYTTDPKRCTRSGDYIFGVRATIGLTTKVFNRYAIGRGAGLARSRDPFYDELLFFVLEEAFEFFTHSATGSIFLNISRKNLEEYETLKFSNREVKDFHTFAGPLMRKIYQNQRENHDLEQIRNLLLPKLLAGEIDLSSLEKS